LNWPRMATSIYFSRAELDIGTTTTSAVMLLLPKRGRG
jgi:hypothetical protein